MLKIFLFTIILLFLIPVKAQDEDYEVRIRHFQRKLSLNYLPMPNMDFQPADFEIKFPDSLYNQAQIEAKKFKLTGENGKVFKNAYVIVISKKKRIQQVNLAIHPKFEKSFESYLKENFSFKLHDFDENRGFINNTRNVLVEKETLKKQINYKFSISKE